MTYIEKMLGQNEQVVLIARQSWIVLLREAIVDLILAILIIGLTLFAQPYLPPSTGYLILLLLLVPAASFLWRFIRWSNREYIVTNRRVIQVDGTVNKSVNDSSLEKVNDVRMTQSLLGRMLNYGDVEILTASELGVNLFPHISDPIKFKTAMLNEKEKLGFDEAPLASPGGPRPADVPTLIASLNALRAQGLITEQEFQQKKAELLSRM